MPNGNNTLQHILQQPYDRARWSQLLHDVFPGVSIFEQPQRVMNGCPEFVSEYAQLGSVRLADGKTLAIFEVRVDDRVNLVRNRVGLRQLVARHIDEGTTHGVLCVFNTATPEYRFTFAARETGLDEDGTIVTTETASRRYTYILGPGETRRTAAERFLELSGRRDHAGMKEVTEAFSVERLNKEFFSAYKAHYQRFVDHLVNNTTVPAKVFGVTPRRGAAAYDAACKPVRDWVKKLLGRIVFIHFLQKKGWMGCPAGSRKWTGGDPNFLQTLFANCRDKGKFHSAFLAPLFFEALNTPDRPGDHFAVTATRVPYLNGGLFEELEPAARAIDFPAALFRELLDFFAAYSFTIDENDPEEHEVGIDPEMLGHIFENLLEDNKDKGAYYTPKAIVKYMCQQSLIHYLQGKFSSEPTAFSEIERLIRLKEPIDPKDTKNWLAMRAHHLEALLDEVKICDPAIGSGAFPIGLLQEIYWTKLTLHPALDRGKAKREIIQKSIYGVDIDAGAVEIARLRCWLALIMEEDQPRPLPNLDYKIMQGDSLLESFEGIPLDQLTPSARALCENVDDQAELDLGSSVVKNLQLEIAEEDRQRFTRLIRGYFACEYPVKKSQLHADIDAFVLRHLDYNVDRFLCREEDELAKIHQAIEAKRKTIRGYKPTPRETRRIKALEAAIAASRARKARLHELADIPERPYFLWHLFFQDVFANGGFDIVIANPPFVRHEVISGYRKQLASHYAAATSRADLFVFFYERAVTLLRQNGVVTFISSNAYYRSGYGRGLRQFLSSNLTIMEMLDFVDCPVFEAISYASIFLAVRTPPAPSHRLKAYTWEGPEKIDRVLDVFTSKANAMRQSDLRVEGWILEPPATLDLLTTLRTRGVPLSKYVGERFYYGIKTGLNRAFVIDSETRDQLIQEDPRSAELIHPFLRGRDVKRWRIAWARRYVIAFPFGFHVHLNKYPAILKHLERFKAQLKARGQCTSSRGGSGIGQHHWLELDNNPKPEYLAEFGRQKVVIPAIERKCAFAVDEDGLYGNDKTTICVSDEALFLCAVLNSSATWWIIRRIAARRQNGYLEFKPMYVSQLPIPPAPPQEKVALEDLARRAAKACGAELEAIERQIDRVVFRLFELGPEEIELIEGSMVSESGGTRTVRATQALARESAANRAERS